MLSPKPVSLISQHEIDDVFEQKRKLADVLGRMIRAGETHQQWKPNRYKAFERPKNKYLQTTNVVSTQQEIDTKQRLSKQKSNYLGYIEDKIKQVTLSPPSQILH